GQGYPICALRPTGIYGAARPIQQSKWFPLVQSIVRGEDVECSRGGKEVHAADVARAVEVLLSAEEIAGEAYSCYDDYISQYDVATIAKQLSGSNSTIHGGQARPKHEIVTDKIKRLGMQFGGRALLEQTVGQLVEAVK
ncbi:MAG: NAD(P)-dependent oxidoreductase, partial [Planctomycetes bacterium]|nr:NAD(P)-dependent oxidoreductase [Planctomycetota bacterium]